jgi:cytoskeleton protein RodZ
MRVVVDGEVQFDGRVVPGTAYPFVAESQIEVLTGNGSALRVSYNGRDLGLMGAFGEVIDRVFTAVGVATPTPTLPPTPTNTPPATPTLTGSETPTFTSTPSITGTP